MPPAVAGILAALEREGQEAVLVGGALRDLLLGRPVKDWDVATSATPNQTASLFPRHHRLGNRHELILVIADGLPVEVSPFRTEPPDLLGDLAHRDFTVDAMAWSAARGLVDTQGGRLDLFLGLIRACGEPSARLCEDPVRGLRAVRLATELGFRVEPATWAAVCAAAPDLGGVAAERIRAELERVLLSPRPAWGLELMRRAGQLAVFFPELLEGVGCRQNQYHRYDVWSHSLLACQNTPPGLVLRLAGLLHDVAKPRCVSADERGRHFYNHEVVGAELAGAMLRRLRFDRQTVERVSHLVRYHMDLHFDPHQTNQSIRRMVRRIGPQHLEDLIWLRRADRLASGTKRGDLDPGTVALLDRIRRLAEEDQEVHIRDLALRGRDVLVRLGREPGPWLGHLLQELRDEVAEGALVNDRQALMARAVDLAEQLDRAPAEREGADGPRQE